MSLSKYGRLAFAILFVAVSVSSSARAHFPWLDVDDAGRPILFFGEDVTDRTYHLPKSMESFPLSYRTIDGATTELNLSSIATDRFVGLQATDKLSADQISQGGAIEGTATYGVYHGSKLVYYAQHFVGTDTAKWPGQSSLDLHVACLPGDLASNPGGATVKVMRGGEPLADAEVKLFCEDGHEEGAAKTNDQGVVQFKSKQVERGLNAVTVGVTQADEGEHEEVAYKGSMHYLTATFDWQPAESAKQDKMKAAAVSQDDLTSTQTTGVEVQPTTLPSLPLELTSFGGIVAGKKLYVYGGHTGNAHSYSTAEQSNQLWRLDLESAQSWESLPAGPRLQGLALVADGDSVVRIGGFTAMNDEGEEHDLRSQSNVSRFDSAKQQWSELPALPEPRSSLAAVAIDRDVYVVGGWSMQGGDTTWHRTAWKLDLDNVDGGWQAVAEPPFQRRALAVAEHNGKLFAIGGMNQTGGPTTETAVYDPGTNRWTTGPALVGDSMTGFGSAAFSLGGRLYASTVSGNVQRLAEDGKRWEVVAPWEPGRFFHVMVPHGPNDLLLIGGANMQIGKFIDIESVHVQ